MRVKVKLFKYFSECPLPWQNMITHLQKKAIKRTNKLLWEKDVSDIMILEELKMFDASTPKNLSHITFKSEEAYTLWCLKYSSKN